MKKQKTFTEQENVLVKLKRGDRKRQGFVTKVYENNLYDVTLLISPTESYPPAKFQNKISGAHLYKIKIMPKPDIETEFDKKVSKLTGSNCPHKNKRIMINSNADFCYDCGTWF